MITGGAGFIGSTLAEILVAYNQVVIYDNFKRDALSGKTFTRNPNLKIINGDILDYDALYRAMQGVEYIIHAAAIAGIDSVIQFPSETLRVNLIGTANVLEAAKNLKRVSRLVDFSTSEVFGTKAFNSKEGDRTEIGAAGEARWIYAVSKLAGEHLAHAYFQEFGLPIVSVRPFNVYGPGQVGESAMQKFIQNAVVNNDIEIYGDGTQIRAWCYIDDFVDGLLRCLEKPEAIGESFNIGNARDIVTIYGLAQTICRVLKSDSKIVFSPPLSVDVELRIPSIEKARDILDFHAKINLEEGIQRTAAWYRQRK
jgi:UDP-glucose 4-epimerase